MIVLGKSYSILSWLRTNVVVPSNRNRRRWICAQFYLVNHHIEQLNGNTILVCAELVDFWVCCHCKKWNITMHHHLNCLFHKIIYTHSVSYAKKVPASGIEPPTFHDASKTFSDDSWAWVTSQCQIVEALLLSSTPLKHLVQYKAAPHSSFLITFPLVD